MNVNHQLSRLGQSTQRLNDGSEELNRLIAGIDNLLARMTIGLDYVHPRPLSEVASTDLAGKRIIELAYVGYLKVHREYHLAIKTVKVVESPVQSTTEAPGEVMSLLAAPRRLRYRAVEVLPDLLTGLAEQVDEMVNSMDRRRQIAGSLLQHLEQIAGPVDRAQALAAADSATSHRRPTLPAV